MDTTKTNTSSTTNNAGFPPVPPKARQQASCESITVGMRVMFSSFVLRQTGHSDRVAKMRGVVLEISGRVASVDCGDTFISEDGRNVRSVPVANLVPAAY